jgi:hypothetical protein
MTTWRRGLVVAVVVLGVLVPGTAASAGAFPSFPIPQHPGHHGEVPTCRGGRTCPLGAV